jgi:hypothetical protein
VYHYDRSTVCVFDTIAHRANLSHLCHCSLLNYTVLLLLLQGQSLLQMALSLELQDCPVFTKNQLAPALQAALCEELYAMIISLHNFESLDEYEFSGDAPVVGNIPESLLARARSAVRAAFKVSAQLRVVLHSTIA